MSAPATCLPRTLLPGQSISAKVTAPSGTTLYYLCALHPWMQGSIKVGAGGEADQSN